MKFLKASGYQDKVSSIFNSLEAELLGICPGLSIEHVGSTSIPNAISKGDLDVLVRVSPTLFNETLEKIKAIGFKQKENTLRTNELCMLVTGKFNYDVAIQLIVEGSEFEKFVTFRDMLRANSDLVREYNDLKLSSEDLTEDEYRLKKSKWIIGVLKSNCSLRDVGVTPKLKIPTDKEHTLKTE